MSEKRPLPLLGQLAVHFDMLTREQVAECTREQARAENPKPIGEYFVDNGYMTREKLQKLLRAQKQIVEQHKQSRAKLAGKSAGVPSPVPGRRPHSPVEPAKVAPRAEPAPATREMPAARTEAPPGAAARKGAEASAGASIPSRTSAFAHISRDCGPLNELLRRGVERGASDVHLHAGSPFRLRVRGNLVAMGPEALDAGTTERLLIAALGDRDRELLERDGQLDFSHSVEGLARFRANIYRQQTGLDGVFRAISPEPPTLEDLGLPRDLARFTNYHQGMVLVTGPTGCGKSSTLAALVEPINAERKEHLISIEDPIEYQFTSKCCLVNQRSVHRHTESFARALRAALREDPDVIVIGELRDLETISLAMTAAETGHFVLATLHTGGAIRTINRLVGSFPSNQQDQVRKMLSESLRAVISQRLIPTADGSKRVPALETLVVTKAVGNLIRENKAFQIQSILQTGAAQGMALLDQSIQKLVTSGVISREEGLRHVEDARVLGGG